MNDADDPIRADVERRLRAVVEVALAGPLGVARAVDACVRRRVEAARDVVETPLQFLRSLFDLAAAPAERDAATARPRFAGSGVIDTDVVATPPTATASASDAAMVGDLDDLPIEEYESLAASQVVARLGSLSAADLRRVRRFEADHRGRRTVLGKIDQLLSER